MKLTYRFASLPADLRAAEALRDQIRSLNLLRIGHDPTTSADPRLDGRTMCAWEGRVLVGTLDVHWGGDGPIEKAKLVKMKVGETVPGARAEEVVVLDAPIVHPDQAEQRPVAMELHEAAARWAIRHGVRWMFSSCHVLDSDIYHALGFSACGTPTYFRGKGDIYPMVVDLWNVEALTAAGSPLVGPAQLAAAERLAAPPLPDDMQTEEVDRTPPPPAPVRPAPRSEKLDKNAIWRQLFDLRKQARETGDAFLSDIQESEMGRLLLGSKVVQVSPGSRIIRRGERNRDLFLVLSGQVEVRSGERRVAVLGSGDVFGEIGLLLASARRTSDVVALSEDTRCLRLNEEHLHELMSQDPAFAARITLGLARALCLKLVRTNGLI